MSTRPQNTAQNHPKIPEFTLLIGLRTSDVIQEKTHPWTISKAH